MPTRIVIFICIFTSFMLAAVALSGLSKISFDQFMQQRLFSKMLATATNIRSVYQQSFIIGLPMSELKGSSDVFERVMRDDNDLHFGAVYVKIRDDFFLLHGLAKQGTPLPIVWKNKIQRDPDAKSWTSRLGEESGVALPILNTFNRVEGVIVLNSYGQYEKKIISERDRSSFLVISLISAAVSLIAALFAIMVVDDDIKRISHWTEAAILFSGCNNLFDANFISDKAAHRNDLTATFLSGPLNQIADDIRKLEQHD